MLPRKNILSIGRDSTIKNEGSQLRFRFTAYAGHHDFTSIILNVDDPAEFTIGTSRVIIAGGKTLPTAFFRALWCAYREASKNKFSAVTTQDVLYAGVIGYLVAKRNGLPLFVQVHGDYLDNQRWFESKIGKYNRLMNVVGKYIIKRADSIRVVSERLRTEVIKNYQLDSKQVVSIPIGTDLSKFYPTQNINREPIIAFAQRLILEKQPMLFVSVTIAIMQKLPRVSVVIAGEGFLKPEMEAAYEKAGVLSRVRFLGAVKQEDLVTLYQSAQCYLHTADWEGWGMPMIEAMASGCPVVTTDTGCAGEAVRDNETGLVVPINDAVALENAVERLLTDGALWQRLSIAGIQEAEKWSFQALSLKNMEWYANRQK